MLGGPISKCVNSAFALITRLCERFGLNSETIVRIGSQALQLGHWGRNRVLPKRRQRLDRRSLYSSELSLKTNSYSICEILSGKYEHRVFGPKYRNWGNIRLAYRHGFFIAYRFHLSGNK